jgi:ketosteroid isomerase-like protein
VSRENVETVRRGWAAFNRGDLDAFLADVAEDAEFEEDPSFPEAGVYRGREQIVGYVTAFQEQMHGHHFEVEELRDLGDRVLALLHETASGASSGIAVDQHPAFLHEFRGDQMVRVRAFLDRRDALKAICTPHGEL